MRKSFIVSMVAFISSTLGRAGGAQAGSAASPFSISDSTAFAAGISHCVGFSSGTRPCRRDQDSLPEADDPPLGPDPPEGVAEML